MSKSIEHVKEFCRLYRVRIPVEAEFDYYIDTLCQSPQYSYLAKAVEDFRKLELDLKGGSPGSFKMDKVSLIKRELKSSKAFAAFEAEKAGPPAQEKKQLGLHHGDFLFSLDLKQADFHTLKAFDETDELPATWEALAENAGAPSILYNAKSFRQLIFGHLNPKKNQRFQRFVMGSVLQFLLREGIPDFKVLSVSTDEIIVRLGRGESDSWKMAESLEGLAKQLNSQEGDNPIPAPFGGSVRLSSRIIRLFSLEKGIYIRGIYRREDQRFRSLSEGLVGVPGNQFYLYFKRHILQKPLEERDLFFFADNHLAKWVIPGL